MLGPSFDSLALIPVTVFVAGLIGSPHCASMCGPLVVNFASKKSHLAFYQIGRLISYSLAGALIGAFGKNMFGADHSNEISKIALVFMAVLLAANGYKTFFNRSLHFTFFKTPGWVQALNQKLWFTLRRLSIPRAVFAGLAGVLTLFLPCGHLYSFLLGAVATGSAGKGALYMAAFWLGSAPLLSFGAGWLRTQLLPQAGHRQKWAGGLLILAGLFSVMAFGLRIPKLTSMVEQHQLQNLQQTESQHELRCH